MNEVCWAIICNVVPAYLKILSSAEKWNQIAKRFEDELQYPNCIGTIDGKHIIIQPPAYSGLHCYNCKHSLSIVLLAFAGPNYECLYADIGTDGRLSDGGVWSKVRLLEAIEEKKLLVPDSKCLPFGKDKVPHVTVADEALPLKNYLIKTISTKWTY